MAISQMSITPYRQLILGLVMGRCQIQDVRSVRFAMSVVDIGRHRNTL